MDTRDKDEPVRTGDVLGLGGSSVPKAPDDPTTEYDEESVRRRKVRASGAEDVPRADPNLERGAGATGIDMGAGGNGTDIE